MRLGGPVTEEFRGPEEWISILQDKGYKAAYCPVEPEAEDSSIQNYAEIAKKNDIIIAEVGVWNNPLSDNKNERKKALINCKKRLELAEKIGAQCCVNIAGSRGKKWDGPAFENLTRETFQMIVDIIQEILDDVKPENTNYTLETMPWIYPDSTESYLELIEAIDRDNFAVHFDPVNIICSPQRYFNNGELMENFIDKLGSAIKSCHLKDVKLREELTVHIDEVRPGMGDLDYKILLTKLDKLDSDLPVMMEHLTEKEQYQKAENYIRKIADKLEIKL